MQWVLQKVSANDINDLTLVEALEMAQPKREYRELTVEPIEGTVYGLEAVDSTSPTCFYGSCDLTALLARRADHNIKLFWEAEWFDPRFWTSKRSDLLNENLRTVTVRELRNTWVDQPTFVKSVGVKALTGMVLEPDKKDRDTWMIEHSNLDGDIELIATTELHRLEREWRFFVINGEILTGSTYRKDGYRSVRWPVSDAAWDYARNAVREWMPSQNIVIDIARTWAGEYKVIEWNSLHSSGFYRSDVRKYVEGMESLVRGS
jgi:hypothetical protein